MKSSFWWWIPHQTLVKPHSNWKTRFSQTLFRAENSHFLSRTESKQNGTNKLTVITSIRWVSQRAVIHKANGKRTTCIDLQALNSALLRKYHKLPTLDDILPKLRKAKLFSKLAIKEAYWHVKLDDRSSMLTTTINTCGRYRWSRLSFGLNVFSKIF